MSRRNTSHTSPSATSNPGPLLPETTSLDTNQDRPAFELSLTQIVASAAAATTAALLGSRLGVAGTILGAAVASLISVVAGAVYSHSIAAARHRVKLALHNQEQLAGPPTEAFTPSFAAVEETLPVTRPVGSVTGPLDVPDLTVPSTGTVRVVTPTPAPRRKGLRAMALGAVATVAVFAVALVMVTGIETVKGTPLSGGNSGGLSVLGGARGPVADADEPTDTGPAPQGGETTAPPTDPTSLAPSTSDAPVPSSDPETTGGSPTTKDDPTTTVTSTVTEAPVPTGTPTTGSTGATTDPSAPSTTAPSTTEPSSTPTTGPTAPTNASTAPTSSGPTSTEPESSGSGTAEGTAGTAAETGQAGATAAGSTAGN